MSKQLREDWNGGSGLFSETAKWMNLVAHLLNNIHCDGRKAMIKPTGITIRSGGVFTPGISTIETRNRRGEKLVFSGAAPIIQYDRIADTFIELNGVMPDYFGDRYVYFEKSKAPACITIV